MGEQTRLRPGHLQWRNALASACSINDTVNNGVREVFTNRRSNTLCLVSLRDTVASGFCERPAAWYLCRGVVSDLM